MPTTLNPKSDLLFKANSQVKIAEDVKKQEKIGNNHLKKRGGKELFDTNESCLFSQKGMHVCGKSKKIQDKLESMSLAILQEDWIDFMTLGHELKEFKPNQKCLNLFGKEQMKALFEREPTAGDISFLRVKLASIGISEEAIQNSFEEGRKILKNQILEEKRRKRLNK